MLFPMKLILVAPTNEWGRIFEEVLPLHNLDQWKLYGNESFELETICKENYVNYDGFTVDCDAVIARGVAVTLLREKLEIPVVQIPMSVFTIERAARKAIERYAPRKIAAIGFNFSMIEVNTLTCVGDVPIHTYAVSDGQTTEVEKELEKLVLRGKEDGCDAFLCGANGVKVCEKYGFP
ncbi:MAG: hypothetical protein HC888_16555, partial [Candidatus Competibacteraceae bacterium]|nr:hypothetical protein [Candidatus Competibacteraceae bacterium]